MSSSFITKALQAKLASSGLDWIKLDALNLNSKASTIAVEFTLEGEAQPVQAEVRYSLGAENVIVVASYWLNYDHLRARASEANDTEKHLTRGVYQVMALVAPFLIGDAREHLNYLKANYLE